MKTNYYILSILFIFSLVMGCHSRSKISMRIDNNFRAEGDIRNDSICNGIIKFYDTVTNKLAYQSTYLNGQLNGERIDYFDNGQISAKLFFENGKVNGYTLLYDTNGNIFSKQFFYYGLSSGESINYSNGKLSSYYFNSLENEPLFYISYDSISFHQRITDFQKAYFFYRKDSIAGLTGRGFTNKSIEYFLYTPNPPNYNFRYSLVKTTQKYAPVIVSKNFENNKPWSIFTIEDTLQAGYRYALRLLITDSVSGGDITMYKFLE